MASAEEIRRARQWMSRWRDLLWQSALDEFAERHAIAAEASRAVRSGCMAASGIWMVRHATTGCGSVNLCITRGWKTFGRQPRRLTESGPRSILGIERSLMMWQRWGDEGGVRSSIPFAPSRLDYTRGWSGYAPRTNHPLLRA